MKIADTSFNKSKVLYQKSLNNSGFYENIIYQQDNRNKNQLKKNQKTPTQNNMAQPTIFKNYENEYWQEVLQVNQKPLPET